MKIRCYKEFEFEKGSRDHNKSKETNSQYKMSIMHQPAFAAVSSNTCSHN